MESDNKKPFMVSFCFCCCFYFNFEIILKFLMFYRFWASLGIFFFQRQKCCCFLLYVCSTYVHIGINPVAICERQ